jgi:hypothetical protein
MKDKIDYKTTDFYKQAKKDLKLKISSKEYTSILNDFGDIIQQKVLNSYFGYKVPKMGRLRITGTKTKTRTVDHRLSVIHKKRIYMFNDHSEGIRFRFSWIQPPYKINNIYKFVPVRKFKREGLATKIRSKKYNFIIV